MKARSRKHPGLAKRKKPLHKTKDGQRPPPPWRTAAATEERRPPARKPPADERRAAATASATAAAATQARRRRRRCVASNPVRSKEHIWFRGRGGRRRGRRCCVGRRAPSTQGRHPKRQAGSEQVAPRLHRPLPVGSSAHPQPRGDNVGRQRRRQRLSRRRHRRRRGHNVVKPARAACKATRAAAKPPAPSACPPVLPSPSVSPSPAAGGVRHKRPSHRNCGGFSPPSATPAPSTVEYPTSAAAWSPPQASPPHGANGPLRRSPAH